MANRCSRPLILIRVTVGLQCAVLAMTSVTYAARSLRTPSVPRFDLAVAASRFFNALLAASYGTAVFLVAVPVLLLRAGRRSAWMCLLVDEIISLLIIAIFPGLQLFGDGISGATSALVGYGSSVVIIVVALARPRVRRWAGVVPPSARLFDQVQGDFR